jgi:hypothetical protein
VQEAQRNPWTNEAQARAFKGSCSAINREVAQDKTQPRATGAKYHNSTFRVPGAWAAALQQYFLYFMSFHLHWR